MISAQMLLERFDDHGAAVRAPHRMRPPFCGRNGWNVEICEPDRSVTPECKSFKNCVFAMLSPRSCAGGSGLSGIGPPLLTNVLALSKPDRSKILSSLPNMFEVLSFGDISPRIAAPQAADRAARDIEGSGKFALRDRGISGEERSDLLHLDRRHAARHRSLPR
jgi:hypothetical protein